MDFLELAKNRYTTKQFDGSKKVADETIAKLKEIIRLSPSSINSQPWKFTFVTNEEIKAKLAKVSHHNEPKVADASLVVVFSVIDNLENFEIQIEKSLPEGSINYFKKNIKHLPEAEIKSWLAHQVYLSLGFFLSAAASLNLDSTPMEGIQTESYDEILQTEGYKTLFAVAVGYRNAEDSNQPIITPKSRLPLDKVISSI
ncbi:MAG: NAD(P)H-dependent oxidoreductase [Bacteroidetes bacterium]|jgi:nitroreductase / dihydropteridine reductase|nr:NAD(P)H-dependent oxidoreductase [Bacteroidota bacterium]